MSKQQQSEAISKLRETLKAGDTVFTIERHVSRSGQQRRISLMVPGDDPGRIWKIDYLVARALDLRVHQHGGVICYGSESTMVYDLGRVLFPDGFGCKTNENPSVRSVSKDHAAYMAQNGYTYPAGRNGNTSGWDNDGGYALKCEEL